MRACGVRARTFPVCSSFVDCAERRSCVERLQLPYAGRTRPSPDRRRICPRIFFIVQENRTVDNLFGGPNPFPGADTVSSGRTLTGTQPLKKVFLDSVVDPDNAHPAWLRACNAPKGTGPPFSVGGPSPCQMNGFSANTDLKTGVLLRYIYSYVDYADTKEYWDIAQKYALGDHFFMGHNSESYTAHQYIFSGQSNNVVDTPVKTKLASLGCHRPLDPACVLTPWGCDSPAGTRTYFLDPNTGQESRKPVNIAPCFGYSSLAGPRVRHFRRPTFVCIPTRSARTSMRST